ncbi:uncharacterized protein LOC141686362 [Apium graveolens]|uniref:uncharacterized protein LOC141686362 n=1 Tax=Apium graveolens TaxID=4045 RepID=UPI003D7AB7B0
MRKDCESFTKKCGPCQLYGTIAHRPPTKLTSLTSPCPFYMWGMDFVGQLPKSLGHKKFIIVDIDYHTKWVEAKALARIKEIDVINFFMENIVYRFGVPRIMVKNNGTQFVGGDIERTFEQLKIQHFKASVAYPQGNGQVEITNKVILQGIKKRLTEGDRLWVDELPKVFWSYRTTPMTSTGQTPFKMVYGTEAVLPIEVNLDSTRLQHFDAEKSSEGLRLNCDLVEEVRDSTHLRLDKYQERTTKYFNSKIKPRKFEVNDLVLSKAAISKLNNVSKLSAPWEGPYKITKIIRTCTFVLAHLDGSPVPSTWNAVHLKKFYQ